MEAIVLAGGLGTRLRSKVPDLPKSMAQVAGRPFLEILLERLISQGCNRFILSVGYLRHKIIDAFGNNYKGIPLSYAIEESPLGTGGAIRLALEQVTEPSALVLNGDTYLEADFAAMLSLHVSAGRPMTMAVTQVGDVARYGGVTMNQGDVTGFIEKGQSKAGWINAGVYALERNFPWPEHLVAPFSFETDVLVPRVNQLQPVSFPCNGRFLDIGVPEDLDRAQVELSFASSSNREREAT
jgi:D-glycero-alpha-D-manno-heptose 1-phosphate guanylyltransferase